MIINPYKVGSRGAYAIKAAIRELGSQAHTLKRPPNRKNSLIINWGNSQFDYPSGQFVIVNDPFEVHCMSNKLKFFENTLNSKDVLEWTRNRDKALEWSKTDDGSVWGKLVFCRMKVEASGGKGIIVWDPDTKLHQGDLPQAPLYTRYVPKTHEYRLHMARSLRGKGFEIMHAQRKVFVKTPQRPTPTDWKVRSHDNGFIFQSQPTLERIPPAVINAALRVMAEYFPKLHFCALDVMYHDKRDRAWVIEGNTAPGLENGTVGIYAKYFLDLEKEYKR